MNKHEIAKKYFLMVKEQDQFIDQLPQSIREGFFDNEYTNALAMYIDYLHSLLLSESELDDMMYFAYETNPLYCIDGKEFDNIFDYWKYINDIK